MNPGLQLAPRLQQSLVLSPQLQQSLALLQAPILELKAMVEKELEQNPVLEELPTAEVERRQNSETTGEAITPEFDPAEPPRDMQFDPATEKPATGPVDDFDAEFTRLAQLDQEWKEHFSAGSIPQRVSEEEEEKRQFLFDSLTVGTSLQDALLEQLRFSDTPDNQRPLAELIIGNLDDAGYLRTTVEELAAEAGATPEFVLEALRAVQAFDPAGVGARDLRECLLLQLERRGERETVEYRIVSEFMEALGRRRVPEIASGLQLTPAEVQVAMDRIARLDPRPGRQFEAETDQYVVPEVFVRRVGDEWVVTTNDNEIPHLRISNTYKDLMARTTVDVTELEAAFAAASPEQKTLADRAVTALRGAKDAEAVAALGALSEQLAPAAPELKTVRRALAQARERQTLAETRNYIREKITAAKFLIKSIDHRQQTILNIAREIVAQQHEFLEKGMGFLRPLTMAQVAQVVGVHETTVSRAVAGKYIETPQGIYELRRFFTTGLQTSEGGAVSNTSVKEMIAEIFRQEDTHHPLADDVVAKMLQAKGINIARRTVAKYRDELGILPSTQRKVY